VENDIKKSYPVKFFTKFTGKLKQHPLRKYTFLSISLIGALASTAQISITSADMPNANDSLYVSSANSVGSHVPAETGVNFAWDYSDLKPILQQSEKFLAPGKFPGVYNFIFNSLNTSYGKNNPLFTAVTIPGIKIDAAIDFFKESTASLNQIGVGFQINGVPLPFIYKHPDMVYKFPMNYMNMDSCDFDFGLALPGYGYYGQSGHRRNFVDGWGELKTPSGTYTTLRITSMVNITDTIYIQQSDTTGFGFPIKRPARYEYKWFAAGSKIPVLEIDAIAGATAPVYNVVFIDTLRKDIIHVGIDENGKEVNAFQVYPNPSQDQFSLSYNINNKSAVKISLLDILGKELRLLVNETQNTGLQKVTVNVSSFPAGIYFVNIRCGNTSHVEKISVVH
jgi:hypothetical protein